jgi:alpha-galactosidase
MTSTNLRSARWRRRALHLVAGVGAVSLAVLSLGSPAWAGDDQGAPSYYSSGLSATPTMGWNTYYGIGGGSGDTEAAVKNVADFLVSSGLASAGYNYVWLDGGWQASTPRNAATGELRSEIPRRRMVDVRVH